MLRKRASAPETKAPGQTSGQSLLGLLSSGLVDLIMPPVCLSCREPIGTRDALCAQCWDGTDFISTPHCDRLGIALPYATGDIMVSAAAAARPPPYARARAVGHYRGTLQRLVHSFKFRDRHDIRRLFGTWLQQAGQELIAEADLLVPVPLSRLRLLNRRFNQAAILAQEISRRSGLPIRAQGLNRTRRTQRQIGLTAEQRRLNVRGAFRVPTRELPHIRGSRVLLIDDVITTGATAEACTKALKQAGAANVDVLAVALVSEPLRVTT
jgi:ComF family protein